MIDGSSSCAPGSLAREVVDRPHTSPASPVLGEPQASSDVVVEEPLNDSERAELARLRRRVVEQEKRIYDRAQDVTFLKKAADFAAMQPK